MEYGRIVQTEYISTPTGSNEICTMRISEDAAAAPRELFVKFPDGTSKQLTGSGSGALTAANNGLNVSGSTVRFGGTLLANTTLNMGGFELQLQNGTMIQRGFNGGNKISGAGQYFTYVATTGTLVMGAASGSQYNTLPTFSFLGGNDHDVSEPSAFNYINGNTNDLAAQDVSYSVISSNNIVIGGAFTTSERWLDLSASSSFNGAMIGMHTQVSGANFASSNPAIPNNDYQYSSIAGVSIDIAGSAYSIIKGTGIELGRFISTSIIQSTSFTATAGSDIQGGYIVGSNLLFDAISLTANYFKVHGQNITLETASTSLNYTDINADTVNATSSLNFSSLRGQNLTTSNISFSQINRSGHEISNTLYSHISGQDLTGEGIQYSIIKSISAVDLSNVIASICIGSFNATSTNINASLVLGGGATVTDDSGIGIENSILSGFQNSADGLRYSIIGGSQVSVSLPALSRLDDSIIVGDGVLVTAAAQGLAAIGIGSAAMKTYTGGGIIPAENFTQFFENQVSLLPAGGITFVSPDGLVRTKLTIDNAGAAVWTVLP